MAHYNRASTMYNLNDYTSAIIDFTIAIELNPNYAEAYYYRGVVKFSLKDKDGACLDWSKAVELGKSDTYDLIKKYCN